MFSAALSGLLRVNAELATSNQSTANGNVAAALGDGALIFVCPGRLKAVLDRYAAT